MKLLKSSFTKFYTILFKIIFWVSHFFLNTIKYKLSKTTSVNIVLTNPQIINLSINANLVRLTLARVKE
jgi:hypothetical protein